MRVGFRRWYDRQLIEGHAWFVTCFICMILVAAMIESFNVRETVFNRLVVVATAVGALALGVLAWRRYVRMLGRAERLGEAATCAACGTYGRFTVIESGVVAISGDGAAAPAVWMQVRCRKCDALWRIE